jgi:glycine C-acetyltransferase
MNEYYTCILRALKADNLYRRLRDVKVIDSSKAIVDGKEVILLCSNDYLGLSCSKEVKDSMLTYLSNTFSISQCSSRLIAGNDPMLNELEHELALHKSKDKALLYANGYMANLALASLFYENTIVYSDELNHASIIDACRLGKARVKVFKHNNIDELKHMLNEDKHESKSKIIVTGVFSMDGDIAILDEISSLSKEYNAMLVVDDAHGDFIYGSNYRGIAEYLNVEDRVDIIVSSLSKGLGCFGGYIASNECIIDYLINKARSFIYTSALPSIFAAAALKALSIVKQGTMQKRLSANVKLFREGLLSMGFNTQSNTHIIPIVVGDEKKALEFADSLLEHGVFAQAIRYPTVAKGKARIRVTLTALHTREDIGHALEVFRHVGKDLALI